ncbi:MAG: hypothetical protein FWH35_00060 [Treponema sp.]|nr:hypothetical protein [Treponema sp.]
MTKTNLKVSDCMVSLGLNPRLKRDKRKFANQLDYGDVQEPMQLRGIKRDSVTGYVWSRKEEYISKYKFGVEFSEVASVLAGLTKATCISVLSVDGDPLFERFLVVLPEKLTSVYVSVYKGEGRKKILRVIPIDATDVVRLV